MSRRVARPYAVALFQVTQRGGVAELRQIEAQLASVFELFRRAPDVLRVFEVPSVPPAAKRKLVTEIGQALGLRMETQRMLMALENHLRLRYLDEVVAYFRELVDRKEGIVRGRVELPSEPGKGEVAALENALAEALAARVELDVRVREELLAGFLVRVGSRVFDGSLLAQVRRFAASAAGE
jgi:F-type H+-transporting ATPase subunit delta